MDITRISFRMPEADYRKMVERGEHPSGLVDKIVELSVWDVRMGRGIVRSADFYVDSHLGAGVWITVDSL